MQFAAAAGSAEEIPQLKSAGASEIYLGFLSEEWQNIYGRYDSMNRRQGKANLETWEELEAMAKRAKQENLRSFLTLNARITDDQLPLLTETAGFWAEVGGSGIIVRDIALLLHLRRIRYPLPVTASLLLVAMNSDAVQLLSKLNVTRIVLPRFLSIMEMESITHAAPEMEFETMIMADHCPYIDGFCRSLHREGLLCVPEDTPDGRIEPSVIRCTCDTSGEAGHLCLSCHETVQNPCAACRLADLEKAGITTGKLGGRGWPLEDRLRDLTFASQARELFQKQDTKQTTPSDSGIGVRKEKSSKQTQTETVQSALQSRYRELYGHECHCYYPPVSLLSDESKQAGRKASKKNKQGSKQVRQ